MKSNTYTAPLKSTPYLALLRCCRNKGIDTDKVNELLFAINAESSLVGFIRIIDNLRLVIIEAKEMKIASPEMTRSLTPWFQHINLLLNHASLLVDECGDQLIAQQKGPSLRHHPLSGICLKQNALYSLLWNRIDTESLIKHLTHEGISNDQVKEIVNRVNSDYKLLQWHMLFMHLSLLREHVTLDIYLSHDLASPLLGDHNNSLYYSCISARDYSNVKNWEKLIKLRLHKASHFFFAEISNALTEELDEAARKFKTLGTKWLKNTARLRGGNHGSRRSKRRRKSTAGLVEYGNNMRLAKYTPSDEPLVRSLSVWDNSDEWTEADLPKDETDDETKKHVLVNFSCKKQGTLHSQVMLAIGFSHRQIIMNQHLPIHYHFMTIGEVSTAMHILDYTLKDPAKSIDYKIVAALGILMYWTGSDTKRIQQLIVVPPGCDVGDDVELAYFMEYNAWRIRVPIYKTKRKPSYKADLLCRPWGEHLFLPDLWQLKSVISIITTESTQDTELKSYKPFSKKKVPTYQKALKEIFKDHASKKGMYITPERLSNDLFLRLLSCDDPVNAMLITGKMHTSVTTTRHYSTPSAMHLTTLYRDVAIDLVGKIRLEKNLDMPKIPPLPSAVLTRPNLGVGAAYCPSINEVKKLLERIREKLANANTQQTYNNFYSIYTALFIGYTTGYRAVRNINIEPSRRDPIGQWAWVSDKNDEKQYHTRRIWLSPILEQQLKAYEDHRRLVIATWENHYPSIKRPKEKELPYLFLIDDKTQSVVPICPNTMEKPLSELNYPLPLNANRKFLRTELSERGCPIDVLNSFMGHWSLGTEPHGPYSSLSPRHERRQLKIYLMPLMNEIGIKLITSRWVKK